ncbi:MFS transporter [Niveispirillum sp. KHB5.9]|uniref:MFS transporter n=1 Tax=Niveispirillum sp. KHB5.9 TaxID=3400269 RepID=UPI003A88A46D
MHRRQWVVVALCIALNALDGFDVLAISFAAPGIAQEWGIDRAVLGLVLSMELLGMATGSVLIGNLADRIGRRPTILACLALMVAGMVLSATARDVTWLSATRLATGLGIGGMISATSAMVAEFSNTKRRSLNMVLNIAGYSVGAILGGLVAAALLERTGDWRSVFLFGAAATLAILPLLWFFLPESIDSLIARRPADALDRVNRTLLSLGRDPLGTLPDPVTGAVKPSPLALFTGGHARVTLLLTVAYFAQIMLFYFVQKWVPKIIVDMGHTPAEATRVLVAANIGSLASAVLIGLASQKLPLRPLVMGSMVAGFFAIALFGSGLSGLGALSLVVAVAAFCINAGVVGLYPIMGATFPAHLRASGIGFVIGVGRGGSAIGPIVAGAMFAAGSGLLPVSLALGAGGLVAALMVWLLVRRW